MDLNRKYNNRVLEERRKQLLQRQQAQEILRQRKNRRADARSQIVAAFDGRDLGPLSAHILRNLGTRKRPVRLDTRDALRRLLLRVQDECHLLGDLACAQVIIRLGLRHQSWIRQPEDWKPRSYNSKRKLASLARHLFALYDVPAFMDAAWSLDDRESRLHQEWFIHVARGDNIRRAPGLPIPLTKMMAHHFCQAPDDCTINQALRWGQLRGMNVPQRLAHAVIGSRLGNEFCEPSHEQFWTTVFNFFALHPTIDPHQVGPIIDYLHNQKFVPLGPVNVGGTFIHHGPPQPGLSMKGRTPDALVQQVNAWHHRLRRTRDHRNAVWNTCGIPGYDRIEGEPPNQRRFFITENLTSAELRAEGAAMHHCVATYAWSCQSGRTAIFSLQADEGAGPCRRLTIEVDVCRREITQARAKYNSPSTPRDQRILNAWATTARLGLSRDALMRAY